METMKKYWIFGATVVLAIVAIATINMLAFKARQSNLPAETNPQAILTEASARVIAEKTCIKGGGSLGSGYYNEGTKTWWFDANLNSTRPGCNPACVVNEIDKTAEINWRCTGVRIQEVTTADFFSMFFTQKYPKYADTLTVKIIKEDATGVKGSITFVSGEPGGMFLATKMNGERKIVYEGNGSVNCTELKQVYKLSADLLTNFCD